MPWYVYMYTVHGMPFIHDFIGFHNISRFAHPLHPVRDHWYFYIPVVLLGFFPWTGLLIQSVKNAYRRSFGEEAEQLAFFQVWWIFVFVFFSFAQTKQVSYMLLLVPPLATIIGWNLAQMLDDWRQTHFGWAGGSAVLFLVMGIGWLLAGDGLPQLAEGGLWLGTLTLILGAAIIYHITASHRLMLAAWLHVIMAVVTMVIGFGVMMPAVEGIFSVKQVARDYAAEYHPSAEEEGRVLYIDKQRSSLRYGTIHARSTSSCVTLCTNARSRNSARSTGSSWRKRMGSASSATMDHNFQKNFWIKEGEFYFVENYYL